MKIIKLFNRHLKQTIKEGYDHNNINCLAGCTERKLVLTEAEAEAGKRTWNEFMASKLWNEDDSQTWMFGSPATYLNIGLVPFKLAQQRLGLNRHCWATYRQIV